MIKLATLLLIVAVSAGAAVFQCPNVPITVGTVGGNLPTGATNLTDVPKGTNCSFVFDIPNNYVLLLKFSASFGSDNDTVIIFDNNNFPRFSIIHQAYPIYDRPLYMPARSAQIQVVGVSGNSKFMVNYMYQSLNNYNRVTKNTGDLFALNTIPANSYVTITSATATEKVIITPSTVIGSDPESRLLEYVVYDGDNINTANVIGRLTDFGRTIRVASGRSVSIVSFTGTSASSYVLGNDASTLNGYGAYTLYRFTRGDYTGNMTDSTKSNKGTGFTFFCTDCSNFYWNSLSFNTSSSSFIAFQGQTPTHRREQLIRYDSMTLTNSYFPQVIPTSLFSFQLFNARVPFDVSTTPSGSTVWQKPFIGRKGYIIAPNLWGNPANTFDYQFRDDTQFLNFTVNINKMNFASSTDQMALKIGTGQSASTSPAVNNLYPRDQSSNGKVSSNGNYMQVALTAVAGADVRLSFEIQKANSSNVIGLLTAFVLTLFYTL